MRILHQILKKIYQDYAVFYPPAKYTDIHKVNTDLVHNNLAPLPQDYINLLLLTNGLFYNGLELFATEEHEREKGAFFHRSIPQMQHLHANNPIFKGKILLAQAPEEFILYDFKSKEYVLIDRYNYATFARFPSFLDILYFFVRSVIEK